MTDTELIARQAKQIEELRDNIANMQVYIRKALLYMICIGGPLNDNKLQYTKDQLVTFYRIQEALNDA